MLHTAWITVPWSQSGCTGTWSSWAEGCDPYLAFQRLKGALSELCKLLFFVSEQFAKPRARALMHSITDRAHSSCYASHTARNRGQHSRELHRAVQDCCMLCRIMQISNTCYLQSPVTGVEASRNKARKFELQRPAGVNRNFYVLRHTAYTPEQLFRAVSHS